MAIMYRKYADYETIDFTTDEKFKRWVKYKTSDDELNEFWLNFRLHYPHKAEMMREAEDIINSLSSPDVHSVGNPQRVWDNIRNQTVSKKTIVHTPIQKNTLVVFYRYAAVTALFIIVTAVIWFFSRSSVQEWVTLYGEQKTIELPDHSIVKLGANSRIYYKRNWNDLQVREIWMQGEGWFNIQHLNRDTTHLKANHRFIVHVENQLDIEVLGTIFLVRNRRGKTHVELESGSIQVNMNNKIQRLTKAGQSIKAIPTKSILESAGNLGITSHDNMATLNDTQVRDILELLEDNYGVKIHTNDVSVLNRTVDGALPLDSQEHAFAALASILNVEMVKDGDVLTLRSKTAAP